MKENTKFSENMCEYESLRNELIATQGTRANLILYMYTAYISLFVLAIQFSHYLYLVTFIILIPFQAKIVRAKHAIIRFSSYIRIFFEEERNDMHWESLNVSNITKPYFDKVNSSFISWFSGTSSIQLGVLSTICFVSHVIVQFVNNTTNPSYIDCFLVAVSIICIFLIDAINDAYPPSQDKELDDTIRKYKNSIEHNQDVAV